MTMSMSMTMSNLSVRQYTAEPKTLFSPNARPCYCIAFIALFSPYARSNDKILSLTSDVWP